MADDLKKPWYSLDYARAANASDKSGLELEQDRRATAPSLAGDPIKQLATSGTLGNSSSPAPRYPGTVAALPDSVKANYGNEGRSIPMPKSLLPRPASPATTAATPGQPAAPGLNVSQTSQPGINKVTGGSLNSPLYTNVGDAAEAVNGLKQPMNSAVQANQIPTLPPSFGGSGNSGSGTGMTIPYPFAKTASPAGDAAAGMPEALQRSANANAIRQSMIDAMPTTFGAGGSLPDQAEQINAQNRQRRREDELLSLAKNNPQVASVAGQVLSGGAQRDVEDKRQGGLAASLGLQVRGQDLNRESQLGQQAIASRSLDLNNARDNARLSLDQERFVFDKAEAERRAALGNADWRLQVTPTTKNQDGSTTMGSIYRYNQRTGQTERVDTGGNAIVPIDQNQKAISIKNNPNMTRDQKVAALRELGYS